MDERELNALSASPPLPAILLDIFSRPKHHDMTKLVTSAPLELTLVHCALQSDALRSTEIWAQAHRSSPSLPSHFVRCRHLR